MKRELNAGRLNMPVLDTQVLFALNPRDPRHKEALRIIQSRQDLKICDTSILEFELVLKGRGRTLFDIRESLLALSQFLASHAVNEEKTVDLDLLVTSSDIQSSNKLSYFDSLVAASALSLDDAVVADDEAFDLVPGLRRIALGGNGGQSKKK
jgi:predicted nucleic acid-binding protein